MEEITAAASSPSPSSHSHSDEIPPACALSTTDVERSCLVGEENSSKETLNKSDDNNDAFLTSQFKAMEEYQKNNTNNNSNNNTGYGTTTGHSTMMPRRLSAPSISSSTSMPLLSSSSDTTVAIPSSSPSSSLSGERDVRQRRHCHTKAPRRRSLLETRGATETRDAISKGNTHAVRCQGCKGRLTAPVHYSLVFCPKCQTVSPA